MSECVRARGSGVSGTKPICTFQVLTLLQTSIAAADGNYLAHRDPHLLLKRAAIASLRQRTLRIERTVEGLQPPRERLGRVAVYE